MGNPYFSIKVLHRRRRKVADNYLHKKVPCLRQMNRFNSLGNVQHFNTHNSNIREKKKETKHVDHNFLENVQHCETF